MEPIIKKRPKQKSERRKDAHCARVLVDPETTLATIRVAGLLTNEIYQRNRRAVVENFEEATTISRLWLEELVRFDLEETDLQGHPYALPHEGLTLIEQQVVIARKLHGFAESAIDEKIREGDIGWLCDSNRRQPFFTCLQSVLATGRLQRLGWTKGYQLVASIKDNDYCGVCQLSFTHCSQNNRIVQGWIADALFKLEDFARLPR